MNSIFLLLPVLLPVLGGAMLYVLPCGRKTRNTIAITSVSLTSLSIGALLLFQPTERLVLLELINGLELELRLDKMGVFYLSLLAVLWVIAIVYAVSYMKDEKYQRMYFAFYVIAYGVTCGISLSGNMLTLFLFYEMLTLTTLPLVIQPMTKIARAAARKYMYFSIGGSAFAFFGLIFLIVYAGSSGFTLNGTLDAATYNGNSLLFNTIYLITVLGFGVKAVVFPLCAWLPSATAAPTPTTALLHAVAVVKSGVFAIIRLTDYSYSPSLLSGTWAQNALLALTAFTIVYGSSMALKETHLKRRLAYSTIANLSYILFGVALMSKAALIAALLHFLFHSMTKIGAFFSAGAIIHASGREYITQMRGLGRYMPFPFVCLGLCGLSLMGFPFFSGFISKYYLCIAAAESGTGYAYIGLAALIISALLTALYMLSIVINAFMPCSEEDKASFETLHPISLSMKLTILIPTVFAVVLGFCSSYIITEMLPQLSI